jgi:hypothetical protein
MSKRKWSSNAFWHNIEKKDKAEAILVIIDDEGRKINQQLTVRKLADDGSPNPDFDELVESLGEEQIDQNTAKRSERKEAEKKNEKERKRAKEVAKELTQLFNEKIRIFELDDVKKSKNKEVKSKIRKSKNSVEMNMWTMLLLLQENGYEVKKVDEESGTN